MGFLALLARLLGLLALAILLSAGWLYRDRLLGLWTGRHRPAGEAEVSATVGHPGTQALQRARDKVDSLNGWRADSVLLSASEMASLLGDGLDPKFRKYLDSLTVELGDNDLALSASLETAAIPRVVLGPLEGMLGPRERIGARGTVRVAKPGWGEWTVRELSVRNFPLPKAVSVQVVEKAMPGSRGGSLSFRIPPGIAEIRIRPAAVILYRKPSLP